jgi:hypothetical protein
MTQACRCHALHEEITIDSVKNMNGILETLKTPTFWFGTVIAGILINIASHFLIQKCGGWISKVSKKWATRTTKLKQEREDLIQRLTNNPQEQNYQSTAATHMRIISGIYLITALLFACFQIIGLILLSLEVSLKIEHSHMATSFFVLSAGWLFFVFIAVEKTISANNLISIIEEARNRQK